jgi:uncharacterized protein YdbL (DUF1318 family)
VAEHRAGVSDETDITVIALTDEAARLGFGDRLPRGHLRCGLVGERYDGYVGLVTDTGPMLRHQVQSINILRRSIYSRFAIARSVTPADVGITAGCQLLATVGVGERYYAPDNSWHQRRPSEAAPVPDYCR